MVWSSRRSEPQNTKTEKLLATPRSWKSSTLLPTADGGKRREDRLLVLRETAMLCPYLWRSKWRKYAPGNGPLLRHAKTCGVLASCHRYLYPGKSIYWVLNSLYQEEVHEATLANFKIRLSLCAGYYCRVQLIADRSKEGLHLRKRN